jgi:hypothetical protein
MANPADTGKTRNFVNVPMDDDLKEKLEVMATEDGGSPENANNAALVRKLIYQEWERRRQVKETISKLQKKGVWPH